MFQSKEHDRTLEEELKEIEVNNLPDKEFTIMLIKMLTKLRRIMDTVRASGRSEERRVGKECLRLCRSRWSPYH